MQRSLKSSTLTCDSISKHDDFSESRMRTNKIIKDDEYCRCEYHDDELHLENDIIIGNAFTQITSKRIFCHQRIHEINEILMFNKHCFYIKMLFITNW